MKGRNIKAIVFDLGNVLIPFNYNRFTNKINGIKPGLGDRFSEFYHGNYHLHRDFEKGILSEQVFIAKMIEALEDKIDPKTFCKYYSDIFSLNEDVVSLLPVLKKGYKLFLLSNTNSIHEKYGWREYDFFHNFEKLILSHEVGTVKPEEKIYRAVERASGFLPGEHFFIDDISDYVNAAKNFGWNAIQFVDYSTLLKDLRERKILE